MGGEPEWSGRLFSTKGAAKATANTAVGPGGFDRRQRSSEGVVKGLEQPFAVLLQLVEEHPGQAVPGVVEPVALQGPQVALRLRLLLEQLRLAQLAGQLLVAPPVVQQ